MLIQRSIENDVLRKMQDYSKAVVMYGARQVGKTTLCQQVLAKIEGSILAINADEQRFVDVLSSRDSRTLLEMVEGYDVLFIDEAQRVPDSA